MKIFISHSSRDKWIARKISEEISEMECETFLDEKDIDTGESIDDEIHNHLHDCEDFLLLLSPDSIKSHWVLIELGGALALKKRIIIILMYLGANDIPQPISKYLARDLNDIEKYYDEVKKRISTPGKKARKRPIKKAVKKSKAPVKKKITFKVGDIVKLPYAPAKDVGLINWNSGDNGDGMDSYLGITATISQVHEDEPCVKIREDGEEYWWAFDWLTKV